VILEEFPRGDGRLAPLPACILHGVSINPIIRQNPSALEKRTEKPDRYLEKNRDLHLPDVAYTLMRGRRP